MTRPLLLDLFCCEGIGARGYIQAGWDVIGIDVEKRFGKRYPGEFHDIGWIAGIEQFGSKVDAIHASPPCQGYTRATAGNPAARAKWPRLIPDVRKTLDSIGKPYVIENVEQAREHLIDPVLLCGTHWTMGAWDADGEWLELQRHRLFESGGGFDLKSPGPCRHTKNQVAGVYGGARSNKWEARHVRKGGYVPASKRIKAELIGVQPEQHTVNALYECIPPQYTNYIGQQLIQCVL